MSKEYHGIYAALVTPYTKDGAVNYDELQKLVRHLISQGIDGFYVAGSTAETFLLSSEERKNDVETLSKRVQLEFISSERKRLSAAIEKAEADGNDEEMRRLMLEMNKLIKK